MVVASWGMDLSLWPEDNVVAEGGFEDVLNEGKSRLLCDHTSAVLHHLSEVNEGTVVDFVVDNAGFELLTDLALAEHLTASKGCKVRFRIKHHPTFKSDVTGSDLKSHLVVDKWKQYFDDGSWKFHADDGYWAMPYAFWENWPIARGDSHLVVIKGDANCRRALGDRPWPLDAPFEKVCSYFPTPTLCLHNLKAELGCGMDPKLYEPIRNVDSEWLTTGKYGIIQFVDNSM